MGDDKDYLNPADNPFIKTGEEDVPDVNDLPVEGDDVYRVPLGIVPGADDDLEVEARKTLKALGGDLVIGFGEFLKVDDKGAVVISDGLYTIVELKAADEETREMVRKALNAE